MLHPILTLYNEINTFGKEHGLTLEVVGAGEIRYRMRVQKKHLATPTVIHGGMLAAFMDCVLGVAALSLACESENLVSTVEFKLNYLAPVYLGDELIGHGKVDQHGKRILFCSGTISNAVSNIPLAKGMGTFNAYPIKKSGLDHLLK
jgi:uncharacterized protein (TIGR00369 family)